MQRLGLPRKAIMKRLNLAILGVAAAALVSPAKGQQLINLGMSVSDMTPDGRVLGMLYEADIQKYILYTWSEAAGATRLGLVPSGQGTQQISSDLSIVGYGGYNIENVGNFPYNSNQGWLQATVARRWTAATGSVNLGLIPGNSSCDYFVNIPNGMSRNGRFLVGGAYTNSTCGLYRAWIYDSNTQVFTRLPIYITPPPASAPSTAMNAWGVSDDGLTVIGYQQNFPANGGGNVQRLAAVWRYNGASWTTTILDPNGGSAGCVSGDGNVIFGKMTGSTSAIRWVRSGTTWTPTNLGGGNFTPLGTNFDGSNMIGEQCFWSPTVNGGVPMDLTSYLASHGLSMGSTPIGSLVGNAVHTMSDDGNKITFNVLDSHSPCLTTSPMMLADLTNGTCITPHVTFSPVSQVIPAPSSLEIVLNVFVSGSWPLQYQWQKETSPGTWTSLTDDNCGTTNPALYDIHSSDTMQLRLGYLGAYNQYPGNYRCVISNECGSGTSGVAVISLTPPPTCGSADFNCDGDVGTDADIEAFFNCLAGSCPAAPCTSSADFNHDGDVGTDADIEAFFRVLGGNPC
jgi:hypothetical protein